MSKVRLSLWGYVHIFLLLSLHNYKIIPHIPSTSFSLQNDLNDHLIHILFFSYCSACNLRPYLLLKCRLKDRKKNELFFSLITFTTEWYININYFLFHNIFVRWRVTWILFYSQRTWTHTWKQIFPTISRQNLRHGKIRLLRAFNII